MFKKMFERLNGYNTHSKKLEQSNQKHNNTYQEEQQSAKKFYQDHKEFFENIEVDSDNNDVPKIHCPR